MRGQQDVILGAWDAKLGQFGVVLRHGTARVVGQEIAAYALGLTTIQKLQSTWYQFPAKVDCPVEVEKDRFHALKARVHAVHAPASAIAPISLPLFMGLYGPISGGFSGSDLRS